MSTILDCEAKNHLKKATNSAEKSCHVARYISLFTEPLGLQGSAFGIASSRLECNYNSFGSRVIFPKRKCAQLTGEGMSRFGFDQLDLVALSLKPRALNHSFFITRDADGVSRACPPGNMAGLPVARHPDRNKVYKKSGQSLSFPASRNVKQFLCECSASCQNVLL
jgi:hypothetical protein